MLRTTRFSRTIRPPEDGLLLVAALDEPIRFEALQHLSADVARHRISATRAAIAVEPVERRYSPTGKRGSRSSPGTRRRNGRGVAPCGKSTRVRPSSSPWPDETSKGPVRTQRSARGPEPPLASTRRPARASRSRSPESRIRSAAAGAWQELLHRGEEHERRSGQYSEPHEWRCHERGCLERAAAEATRGLRSAAYALQRYSMPESLGGRSDDVREDEQREGLIHGRGVAGGEEHEKRAITRPGSALPAYESRSSARDVSSGSAARARLPGAPRRPPAHAASPGCAERVERPFQGTSSRGRSRCPERARPENAGRQDEKQPTTEAQNASEPESSGRAGRLACGRCDPGPVRCWRPRCLVRCSTTSATAVRATRSSAASLAGARSKGSGLDVDRAGEGVVVHQRDDAEVGQCVEQGEQSTEPTAGRSAGAVTRTSARAPDVPSPRAASSSAESRPRRADWVSRKTYG